MASTTPMNGPRAIEPQARPGGHPTTPAGGRADLDRTAPPVQVGPLGAGAARRYWPLAPALAIGGGLYWLGTVSPVASAVAGAAVVLAVVADDVRRVVRR